MLSRLAMNLSAPYVISWFNTHLSEYMHMYQNEDNNESVMLCEKLPCIVITTSRVVKYKNENSDSEVEMLVPSAAWSSDLLVWTGKKRKDEYVEHRCSMYEFPNLQALINYVRLIWLLKEEIPCLCYRRDADEQRLRLVTDVNDIQSKKENLNSMSLLIKPYFRISN